GMTRARSGGSAAMPGDISHRLHPDGQPRFGHHHRYPKHALTSTVRHGHPGDEHGPQPAPVTRQEKHTLYSYSPATGAWFQLASARRAAEPFHRSADSTRRASA